jgi:hypothetical protein
MHNTVKNLIHIEELIRSKVNHDKLPTIIAVSKTFPIENVLPLIALGGISDTNLKKLSLTRCSGFAGISFFEQKKGP